MSLCHDERDFAMGFSRHDPHAQRTLDSQTKEAEKKREEYIQSLTWHQRRALDRVEFCLAAIGQYCKAKSAMVNIFTHDVHTNFPTFARRMGYRGPFYRMKDDKCPAVSITFPETEKASWILNPYLSYDFADKTLQKSVSTKKAQKAALEFCKQWLPDWDWEKVVLK